MSVFVHEKGICETTNVGDGTRIWAFAHVLPGARLGKDCNICDNVFIENDVVIGDRVTVKCGVQVWDGVRLESDVFVGPNATFTNDPFPRSKRYVESLCTVVREGASIGANSTILPGLEIGKGAMVGAGAVVTRSVPPYAVVVGNPARITGYVQTEQFSASDPDRSSPVLTESQVRGVYLRQFPQYSDARGALTVGNFEGDIPFKPARFFVVFDVPSKHVRGEHAHKECEQFLVCTQGQAHVVVDDGVHREEYALDSPSKGLYIPRMVWGIQYKFSADAALLVFASLPYDAADYIRNYEDFVHLVS